MQIIRNGNIITARRHQMISLISVADDHLIDLLLLFLFILLILHLRAWVRIDLLIHEEEGVCN